MSILLEAKGLSFAYEKDDYLLKDVNLTLKSGEIIGIMGASGSGKTTLTYCLSGIIPHLYMGNISGTVELEGQVISQMRVPQISEKLGILFQNSQTQLFSTSLEDDIVFGPENLCWGWNEMDISLKDSLAVTKMEKFRLQNPKKLSGGESQLAALSAVLAVNPQVLIFDESMAWLDDAGIKVMLDCIKELSKKGKGIIIIDHDENRLNIATHKLKLEGGKLNEIG